jgi:hypothetical protein
MTLYSCSRGGQEPDEPLWGHKRNAVMRGQVRTTDKSLSPTTRPWCRRGRRCKRADRCADEPASVETKRMRGVGSFRDLLKRPH